MHKLVSKLPRATKQLIVLAVDVLLVPFALLAALSLQQNGFSDIEDIERNWFVLLLLMSISGLLAVVLGIHKIQLKVYESHAIGLTAMHAALLGMATAVMHDLAGHHSTPLATLINFTLVYFLMVITTRMAMLQLLLAVYRRGQDQCRVLIYGAGRTGRQLAAALRTDDMIFPVAFADDNKAIQGAIVRGLTVYAPKAIERLIKERNISRVLLAMPDMPRPKIARLSRRLEGLGVDVQALPSFAQLAGQEALVGQLQPVVPGRFLGRAPLDAEMPGGSDVYMRRHVLITGAGGSIGSELCRQVVACGPVRIILFDVSELALYTIDMELRTLAGGLNVEIIPVLGSISDAALVQRTMIDYGVQVILHAAAYKHVPLVEKNPIIGMSNNVLGTQVVAEAAAEADIERFILISTDKAVRPKNMMGASKRLAEMVVQDLASRHKGSCVFSMVRFGNVIGSSGSVIPLFQDQIQKGGPVTLTHREVTRYFMTIPEAARLVLVAGSFASGGEVFVLDMGDPIPIYDLAQQMIEAAGYKLSDGANLDGDIEIEITGLRPGEKIHEELLIGEGQLTTAHPKILQAREVFLSEIEVAAALKALRHAIDTADGLALRAVIVRWVEGGDAFLPSVEGGKVS